jgi:hypothetical protein
MLKRMPYHIPKIAQMLQELWKFSYAISLHLNMGYYTIKIDPDAQNVCTIVTPFGKYQYLRLPMGVSCSPYIFQEKMSDLVQDLDFVQTYLDDLLIIACSTVEDHLQKLERVLKILSDKGLRVNAENQPFVQLKSNTSGIGSIGQVYNQFLKRSKPLNIWYVQLHVKS